MIRVAVVGVGNIVGSHVEAYFEFPDRCKIVALVDIYPEKAHKYNADKNLNADVYSSYKDLLKRDDIDLVSVCTPPYTHAEISIDLMEHGMNVLCEKPMASSLEECDKMIEAMKRTGKRLSIISQNRFQTPIYNLKKFLDSGEAGRILHAQVDSFWWRAHSYYDLWWRGTWEKEGGGCTLNHAVHHIDMLCWMMGRPDTITAVLSNINHDNSEVEDFSIAIGKYKDGSISTLTSSLIHHGEDQKFVFQCEKARVGAPWNVYASKGKLNGFFEKDKELTKQLDDSFKKLKPLKYTGHTGQIDDVLRGIETGEEFLVLPEQARTTIEYITAVYKSGFTGKEVKLPLSKDDEWYTAKGIQKNVKKFNEKTTFIENFEDSDISVESDYK